MPRPTRLLAATAAAAALAAGGLAPAALADAASPTATATTASAAPTAPNVVGVSIGPVRPVVHAGGGTWFHATVPGAGRLIVRETAWNDNFTAGFAPEANRAADPLARFTFARTEQRVSAAGTVAVRLHAGAAGRRLLAHHRFRPLLRLWVTFVPTSGERSNVGVYGLRVR